METQRAKSKEFVVDSLTLLWFDSLFILFYESFALVTLTFKYPKNKLLNEIILVQISSKAIIKNGKFIA